MWSFFTAFGQSFDKGWLAIANAFQIFLSETNEPNENETWSLNFPIDNFLQKKQHIALLS